MKDATRSNVSAWARRFNVEVTNYERACTVADTVYGGPSRRGAIFVVAMKAVSTKFDLPMSDKVTRHAAQVVTNIVYKFAYTDESGMNAHLIAREFLAELVATGKSVDTCLAVGSKENALVEMALDAVAVRNTERTRPSMANVIRGKIR